MKWAQSLLRFSGLAEDVNKLQEKRKNYVGESGKESPLQAEFTGDKSVKGGDPTKKELSSWKEMNALFDKNKSKSDPTPTKNQKEFGSPLNSEKSRVEHLMDKEQLAEGAKPNYVTGGRKRLFSIGAKFSSKASKSVVTIKGVSTYGKLKDKLASGDIFYLDPSNEGMPTSDGIVLVAYQHTADGKLYAAKVASFYESFAPVKLSHTLDNDTIDDINISIGAIKRSFFEYVGSDDVLSLQMALLDVEKLAGKFKEILQQHSAPNLDEGELAISSSKKLAMNPEGLTMLKSLWDRLTHSMNAYLASNGQRSLERTSELASKLSEALDNEYANAPIQQKDRRIQERRIPYEELGTAGSNKSNSKQSTWQSILTAVGNAVSGKKTANVYFHCPGCGYQGDENDFAVQHHGIAEDAMNDLQGKKRPYGDNVTTSKCPKCGYEFTAEEGEPMLTPTRPNNSYYDKPMSDLETRILSPNNQFSSRKRNANVDVTKKPDGTINISVEEGPEAITPAPMDNNPLAPIGAPEATPNPEEEKKKASLIGKSVVDTMLGEGKVIAIKSGHVIASFASGQYETDINNVV